MRTAVVYSSKPQQLVGTALSRLSQQCLGAVSQTINTGNQLWSALEQSVVGAEKNSAAVDDAREFCYAVNKLKLSLKY